MTLAEFRQSLQAKGSATFNDMGEWRRLAALETKSWRCKLGWHEWQLSPTFMELRDDENQVNLVVWMGCARCKSRKLMGIAKTYEK